MLWTALLTTHHRSAVEDLFSQVTTSMNEMLKTVLSDTNKLAKQSAQVWHFTGAPTSNVSQLDIWAVSLMEDLYSTNGISQIAFASTDGAERVINSTANGM